MRPARMIAQGDFQLIALAPLAEQPRHGYDIIKFAEERSAECYVSSASVINSTLSGNRAYKTLCFGDMNIVLRRAVIFSFATPLDGFPSVVPRLSPAPLHSFRRRRSKQHPE